MGLQYTQLNIANLQKSKKWKTHPLKHFTYNILAFQYLDFATSMFYCLVAMDINLHMHEPNLISSLLQSLRRYSGIQLAVLLQDGVQTSPWGPLENETKRLQHHTNEVYHVGMLQTMENGHLCTNLNSHREDEKHKRKKNNKDTVVNTFHHKSKTLKFIMVLLKPTTKQILNNSLNSVHMCRTSHA